MVIEKFLKILREGVRKERRGILILFSKSNAIFNGIE